MIFIIRSRDASKPICITITQAQNEHPQDIQECGRACRHKIHSIAEMSTNELPVAVYVAWSELECGAAAVTTGQPDQVAAVFQSGFVKLPH